MMEQVPSLDGATPVMTSMGEFGFVWKKQAKFFRAAMKQLRSKTNAKFAVKPEEDMSIFASFNLLSDDGAQGKIHRLIKDDEFTVLQLSDFREDSTSIEKCVDSGKPYVAHCRGSLGMAYFSQNDFYFEWYMKGEGEGNCYWYDEERFIGSAEVGTCFFIPYDKVLEMHKWQNWEDLIVSIKELKVLVDFQHGSSKSGGNAIHGSSSASAAGTSLNSIMKGSSNKTQEKQKKSVKIDRTPAVAPTSRASDASEGVTTGGSSSSSDEDDDEEGTGGVTTTYSKKAAKSKVPKNSRVQLDAVIGEVKEEGPPKLPRVPGPSDHVGSRSAILDESESRVRQRGRASGAPNAKDIDKHKQKVFGDNWKGMKDAMGWRVEWKRGLTETEEYFMSPLSDPLNLSTSVENLEYFHTKEAISKHIETNPCLTYEWKQLLPLLEDAGWTKEVGKNQRKSMEWQFSRCNFVPTAGGDTSSSSSSSSSKPKAPTKKIGVHRFYSKNALCLFVNRFPFVLQDDKTLMATLEENGWTKSREAGPPRFSNVRFMPGQRHIDLKTIRDMLWTQPFLLFSTSDVPVKDLMKAIAVPVELAKAADVEPDTPSPSKISHQPTPTTLDSFLADTPALSSDSLKSKFVSLLDRDGWKLHDSLDMFEGKWYRFEKITLAPWFDKKADEGPVLGMNAFWAAEDIFKYMKKHGSSRPETTRAITLEVDYRKTSVWGLGRGIQHMAAKYSWSERHIVLELLEDAGWHVMPVPKQWPWGSIDGNIYVPSWNTDKVNEENLHDDKIDINQDYFCDIDALIKYLVKNGNVEIESTGRSRRRSTVIKDKTEEKSSLPQGGSNKRSASESTKPKMAKKLRAEPEFNSPEDEQQGEEEEEDKMKDGQDDSDSEESESSSSSPASSADDRIARVIKSKGKHAFPDVWKILRKELNWKCVNDSKGISVHVAPWSGGMVGNTRFQATPDDQVNRSYFYEKDDLLRYLKKYGPNKVETDPTPPEPLGRGMKRKIHGGADVMPTKRGAAADADNKTKKSKASSRAATKGKKPNHAAVGENKPLSRKASSSSSSDDLNEDELAAMYSSDEGGNNEDEARGDNASEDGEDHVDESSAGVAAAPLPEELDDAEEAIWKAGIPTFLDNFRVDATALYKSATGRRGDNGRWVDVMKYNDVIKVLRAQQTWNWGYYRDGIVEGFIVHRIQDHLKRSSFAPKHLVDYVEGRDYFFEEDGALEFIHGQLRAFGCHVNKMSWDARQQQQGFTVTDPVTVDESSLWHFINFHVQSESNETGYENLMNNVAEPSVASP